MMLYLKRIKERCRWKFSEFPHSPNFSESPIYWKLYHTEYYIVRADRRESLDYYKRIEVAEIEGDLLAAVLSKNLAKIESKYKRLIEAQKILNHSVAEQLNEGQV